jgi:DNA-directed RNA polymerase subunit RPC12/RpoP
MKILKLGKLKRKNGKKICRTCGTKFEYEPSDVRYDEILMVTWVQCPACGKNVIIKY